MPLSILTQFFNFDHFNHFNSCFYLVFLLNPPQHVRLFKILVSLANQSIINKICRAMIINLYFYTRSIIPEHPASTRDGTSTWIKPGSTGTAQYPTRRGKVLGAVWYLPTSKTILMDLKLVI